MNDDLWKILLYMIIVGALVGFSAMIYLLFYKWIDRWFYDNEEIEIKKTYKETRK